MRRIALLGLILSASLALSGCGLSADPTDYVGNPTVGFGGFLADTHTFFRDPNRPDGDAENMQRAEGGDVTVVALVPDEGNIWPGPIPPELTLNDLENGPDAMARPQTNGPIGNTYTGKPRN